MTNALQDIGEKGVTLNPEKCEFSKNSITFLGHVLGKEGIHSDPEKTTAIVRMNPPKDVSELRRFLGMVNQLTPRLAHLTEPLRVLLGKNATWEWGPPQTKAFSQVKTEISRHTVLTVYNLNEWSQQMPPHTEWEPH